MLFICSEEIRIINSNVKYELFDVFYLLRRDLIKDESLSFIIKISAFAFSGCKL